MYLENRVIGGPRHIISTRTGRESGGGPASQVMEGGRERERGPPRARVLLEVECYHLDRRELQEL